MEDSPHKQALDRMESLCKRMNYQYDVKNGIPRLETLSMLWEAFELGKKLERRNIPDFAEDTENARAKFG